MEENNNWHATNLGDVVQIITGFPFKSSYYTNNPKDIALLRGDNIGQGELRWGNAQRWSQLRTDRLTEYFLREGDVVIAMDRPWIEAGLKYAVVTRYDLPCLLVQRVARLRSAGKIDQKFLSCLIASSEFTNHVLAVQTGTAVPHISTSQIKEFNFINPPLSKQRTIGNFISSIVEKIELNSRMNKTLEKIALTLFKKWFVDFEGQSELVDSELGKIPKGYKVAKIKDLGDIVCGKTPSTKQKENFGNDIPFITIPDMHKTFVLQSKRYLSRKGADSQKNLMLPPLSVCVSCIATPGLVTLTSVESQTNQQINSIVPHKNISPYYCYILLQNLSNQIKRLGSGGSVFLNLSTSRFSEIPILFPDQNMLCSFHDLCEPFFKMIHNNQIQSNILEQVRDLLLPKLLSGKISI